MIFVENKYQMRDLQAFEVKGLIDSCTKSHVECCPHPATPVPRESRESCTYRLNGLDYSCPGFYGIAVPIPCKHLAQVVDYL